MFGENMSKNILILTIFVTMAFVMALLSTPNAYAQDCGNSIPDPAEECDDGNTVSGDGCSSACLIEAELFNYDLVCNIEQVTEDGQAVDTQDIRPGDRVIVRVPVPLDSAPPSATGEFEGGEGAYWDLVNQVECTHIRDNDVRASGVADQSRAITENGLVDAAGWDSVGNFYTSGNIDFQRCAGGVRDANGQNLTTHLKFPGQLRLIDWVQKECAMEGISRLTGLLVIGSGTISLISGPNKTGGSAVKVGVTSGDPDSMISAIEYANALPAGTDIEIIPVGDFKETVFIKPYRDSGNALPVITSRIKLIGNFVFRRGLAAASLFRCMQISDGKVEVPIGQFVSFEGFASEEGGGALLVDDNGFLIMRNVSFRDNYSLSDGGALLLRDNAGANFDASASFVDNSSEKNGGAVAITGNAGIFLTDPSFSGNTAQLDGGGIYRGDTSRLTVVDGRFSGNMAGRKGGAIAIGGVSTDPIRERPPVVISNSNFSIFRHNLSEEDGCEFSIDIAGDPKPGYQVKIASNIFYGKCENSLFSHSSGNTLVENNTFVSNNDNPVMFSTGTTTDLIGNIFLGLQQSNPEVSGPGPDKPEVTCVETGDGFITSLGYNISADDSCNLNHPSDLPNTDAMLSEPGDDGIPIPLPGSPVIDHGPADLVQLEGNSSPSLPCGWRDASGLGSPQDGDGDGGFECDSGAVEALGTGAIQAGHSGAFFNSQRSGEGQYVEILDNSRALIYTFSYKPDGSGPAWFLGVGSAVANSLVTEEMIQPKGSKFGDDFNTNDIDFAEWGGMSMVFPACASNEAPGNVVFSGNPELGYDPLITRAERISDIAGCGGDTLPHENAGLSGSFFDPLRSGEGLIVEWLPDGRVLAIMFTFDPAGNQMWMFGVAEAVGKSVTMDVVYPIGFPSWGGAFDPGQLILANWGSFTLSWTDCDTLVFEYDSMIAGYGSATLNYVRLSSLSGLDCPVF